MFFITRIPRTAALMLSGAAMSLCGLVTQLLTQNRFVEPTSTGTIEWAGLGLIFTYVLIPSPSLLTRMGGAIIFSFIGTMVFFIMIQRVKLKSSLVVPIIGIMMGAVVSAISTFLGLTFSMSQTLEVWFQGSFSNIQVGSYEYLWFIVFITVAIYILSNRLTVVGLGKDVATNLGVNYQQVLMLGTGLVAMAVGIVAAVVGKLPYLGLVVPNLISLYLGDNLRQNLPWVALSGMGIITLCDIFARLVIRPFEVPVSLILGSLGAFIFIAMLMRQRRRES